MKKPNIKSATGLNRLDIIEKGVKEFQTNYQNTIYPDKTIAKQAIYCTSIEVLETIVYPFLLKLGIADYVSPEFNKINNTDSFLLVLSPDRDYFRLWPFLVSAVKTTGLILVLRVLYLLFIHNQEKIIELWNKLMILIF